MKKRIRLYNSETQRRRDLFAEVVDNVVLAGESVIDSPLELFSPSEIELEGTERLARNKAGKVTYWRTYLAVSSSPETGIIRRLNRLRKLIDLPTTERPSRIVFALAKDVPDVCVNKIKELGSLLGNNRILLEVWGAKDVRQHIGAQFKIVCPAFEESHLRQLVEHLANSKRLFTKNGESASNSGEKPLGTLFVSYSRADTEFTDKLVKMIVPYMEHIWYDKHEILVGDNILNRIGQGIDKADYVAVVLSNASIESSWVQTELASAFFRQQDSGKLRILPVLKEKCSVPPLLRHIQYADFTESFEAGINHLLHAISTLGARDA